MSTGKEGNNLVTEKGVIRKQWNTSTDRGKAITRQFLSLLWSDAKNTKLKLFNSIVEFCVTYGSEMWNLNQNLNHGIAVVENGY